MLLRLLSPMARRRDALRLGVVLGAGLLTKAFFIPITVGIGGFLILRWLAGRERRLLTNALFCLLVAGAIGGAWYLRNLIAFDNLLGTNDFIRLSKGIGFWAGLEQNFSVPALLRGVAAIAGTYVWAGTWSLAQPPEYVLLPPILLVGLCVGVWLRRVASRTTESRRDTRLALVLPAFFILPMAGGLVYHLLTAIAETGRGAGTPGWYLHILAAPIGAVLALGWSRSRLFAGLATASATVGGIGWVLQLSLFSGCAVKSGDVKYYDLSGSPCLFDWAQLGTLGFPQLGVACLAVGALFLAGALLLSRPAAAGPIRQSASP